MYILLNGSKAVQEIIPDFNPIFPDIPIEQRYSPDFVAKLLHFPDETEVGPNWTYDESTNSFSLPYLGETEDDPDAEQL